MHITFRLSRSTHEIKTIIIVVLRFAPFFGEAHFIDRMSTLYSILNKQLLFKHKNETTFKSREPSIIRWSAILTMIANQIPKMQVINIKTQRPNR